MWWAGLRTHIYVTTFTRIVQSGMWGACSHSVALQCSVLVLSGFSGQIFFLLSVSACHVGAPIPNSNVIWMYWKWFRIMRNPKTYKFPGSSLPVDTSNMLFHSYMCHHHLTQAKINLLQLLQMQLPENNEVPPSLYKFEKKYWEFSWLQSRSGWTLTTIAQFAVLVCLDLVVLGVLKNIVLLAGKWRTHHISSSCRLLISSNFSYVSSFHACILPENKPTTLSAVFVWTVCPDISYTLYLM